MRSRLLLTSVLVPAMLIAGMLSLPSTLLGQGITSGSIKGAITDTSGAIVPEAKVTVTNEATGTTQTITTGTEGIYGAPNLAVGDYTVKVEKEGFKTEVRSGIRVSVGTSSVIDVQMAVGSITQTVSVQAQVVPITEDKGERAVVLPTDTIQELPLVVSGMWRQVDSFLTLAPGVTGDTFSARFNGGPTFSQDFFYDGMPYMNADGGGRQEGCGPAFESVDEYSIVTNAYSAQYGRGAGLMNFHFRSGTNQLHGSAWEFMRQPILDARGFYGSSRGTTKQNEFGFRVGGPVYIPKVYNGKNKTFFFFLINWYKQRGGSQSYLQTLPTTKMLQGDFSELLDTSIVDVVHPIYDPLSGTSTSTRTVFTNNIIPADRLSALSMPYVNLIPAAELSGVTNNHLVIPPPASRELQYVEHQDRPQFQ